VKIGVIGGSGLYQLEGLSDVGEITCETPFGAPSDVLIGGRLGETELVFLPRHGRGHTLLPSELNHRANIFAMKQLGVEKIISVSAVGSFREDMAPGHVVLIDQFVDRTKRGMDHTFFGNGLVAHIAFAEPICPALRDCIFGVCRDLVQGRKDSNGAVTVHNGGTYLNMEGPAFSTLAESLLYKSWGMDVIGMTNLAEAKLAREAEICYVTLAMVTDYDCWHTGHESVSVEMVVQTLMRNAELAGEIIQEAVPGLAAAPVADCPCRNALADAILTDRSQIPVSLRRDLAPIVGKYLH
jgi:5'-methylthioadenosine phosphorylase